MVKGKEPVYLEKYWYYPFDLEKMKALVKFVWLVNRTDLNTRT